MLYSFLSEGLLSAELIIVLASISAVFIIIFCIKRGLLFSNQENPIARAPSSSSPLEKHRVDDGRFLTGPVKDLGGGAFSTVREYRLDGIPVAVKIPTRIEYTSMQKHELELLEHMKQIETHPNIITFHCSVEVNDMTWIVMDLMKGTVRDLLDSNPGLSWNTKLSLARQLLGGIAYLHCLSSTRFTRHGIVHQDIKTANLLVDRLTDDPMIKLKITDFGLARQIDLVTAPLLGNVLAEVHHGNVGGTLAYAAPEIYKALCDRKESKKLKSDVFSAGITLWELATGRAPERTITEISQGKFNAFEADKHAAKSDPGYPRSAFFCPIIDKCVKAAPGARYSAKKAFEKVQQIVLEPEKNSTRYYRL